MKLSRYIFRQFLPSFIFGFCLFLFVLVLDKLFDLLDLIFNKGVGPATVLKLFLLIVPSVLPLTIPMAMILACLVTFGRLSEENQLTAVRAAGIPLQKILWIPLLFALALSIGMVPVNTKLAPLANQSFVKAYEQLVSAEPLIEFEPHKFFAVKNIRFYADELDKQNDEMKNLFVYQLPEEGGPPERIFARKGKVQMEEDTFSLHMKTGQLQKLDPKNPRRFLQVTFGSYDLSVPLNLKQESNTTRYRNLTTVQLKKQIEESLKIGMSPGPIKAELNLRYAMAFAPLCLVFCGIPLATHLNRGSRSFGFGISIVVIFFYYLFLLLGLTLAEKALFDARLSLWLANTVCLGLGGFLSWRMLRQ